MDQAIRAVIIRVPEDLHRRLKVASARVGRTMQEISLEALVAQVEVLESSSLPQHEEEDLIEGLVATG